MAKLEQARKLILSQALPAPFQSLDNTEEQFKTGFKCVDDNLRNATVENQRPVRLPMCAAASAPGLLSYTQYPHRASVLDYGLIA